MAYGFTRMHRLEQVARPRSAFSALDRSWQLRPLAFGAGTVNAAATALADQPDGAEGGKTMV